MGSKWLLVLVLAACMCAICAHALADVTPIEGSALLRALSQSPSANLKSEAAKLVKSNPVEARLLTLDLIFYRWAASSWEIAPAIPRLDDIAAALVAASADRAVIWSASELGPASWGAKPLPSDSDDETVKAIRGARDNLRNSRSLETSSPPKSIESLVACESMVHNLGLELSAAFVDTRLGERHLYTTHRYRDAELFYERARPILSAYELHSRVAIVFQDLGHLNEEANRYDEARESYDHAAQKWLAAGRGDLAGRQYVNAGLALSKLGKDRAFATMRRGLDYSRNYANTKAGSFETHARLLLDVAHFCLETGRNEEARGLLMEQSLETRTYDPLLRAEILATLAEACRAANQVPSANKAATERTKLLSGLAQNGQDALAKLAALSIPVEERIRLLGVVETAAAANAALDRHQPAVDLLKVAVSGYETMKMSDDTVRALRSLAASQDALGDRRAALDSRTLAAQVARLSSRFDIAIEILRDNQKSTRDSGDINTSLDFLREASQVAKGSGNLRAQADLLYEFGTALMTQNKPDDAVSYLADAAGLYNEVGDMWSAANSVARLAEVRTSLRQNSEAISMLAGMVQRIEKWATDEGINPAAEPDHLKILVNLYGQLIVLEVREGRKEEALGHLRMARQYTWYSDLAAYLTSTRDRAVIVLLDSIPPDTSTPAEQPGQIRQIAVGWPAVIAKVPTFSGISQRPRTIGPPVVNAIGIYRDRTKLPADRAIVAYALDDADVYILVATRRTATAWKITGVSDDVIESVQAFRSRVADIEKSVNAGMTLAPVTNWTDPKVSDMLDPLFDLHDILVAPILPGLQSDKIASIVFALPDRLAGIPFHALPREVKNKPGAVTFLLQNFTIGYIGRDMLGNITSPAGAPISRNKESVAVFTNATLPGATAEAKAIKAAFPNCKVFVNSKADEFVRQCAISGIVHIATHHRPDPDPNGICLVLGGGEIRQPDFMRLNNPGLHLAVLSACEGVGSTDAEASTTAHTAETFINLGGFPTFVGGLWKVSDKGSTRLMTNFYNFLASTGQKARSLRLAQESMIKSANGEFTHPYYWAGFALYGDPR